LLGTCILVGLYGVSDMVNGASDLQKGEKVLMHSLTGTSWNDLKTKNPEAANLIEWKFRTDGASLVTIALLSGVVVLTTGFRRGERWSWVAMWVLLLWMALTVLLTWNAIQHPGYGTPVPIISGSILFVLWVAFLAMAYGKFFRQ
jgi:cytochrome bd-type quinol oxidase subunit 2